MSPGLRVPLGRLSVLAAVAVAVAAVSPASAHPDRTHHAKPLRVWRWAFILRSAVAHRSPSRQSPRVGRLATTTPERSTNLVLVLRWARDSYGRSWVQVRLPMLPNGTTGWVRRDALGVLHRVRTHLVVDTNAMSASLYRGGRLVFRTPIGVGRPKWPTPHGEFYVRDLLRGFHDPFYGPAAFGTSARSAVLTRWPGGGFIGIHGTDRPELLPGRVSHGCIRMRNRAIRELARRMPVGTPVTIH
jgi:L,D-transpeptidase-like protein